jgi:CheY-like chemotaxis protein
MARILVIEDNPADLYLIEEAFKTAGVEYTTEVLSDGEAALRRVRGSFEDGATPHLILMDMNLPKADPAQLLQAIRGSSQLSEVPVAVLTSSESPEDRRAMRELGATAHLVKPSELDAFLSLGHRFKALLDGAA